jgi:hypothetical protein
VFFALFPGKVYVLIKYPEIADLPEDRQEDSLQGHINPLEQGEFREYLFQPVIHFELEKEMDPHLVSVVSDGVVLCKIRVVQSARCHLQCFLPDKEKHFFVGRYR